MDILGQKSSKRSMKSMFKDFPISYFFAIKRRRSTQGHYLNNPGITRVSKMLHFKFQDHQSTGSGEEIF